MADEKTDQTTAKTPGGSMDAAVVQIRDVTKWLIGGFAAVGVALAAGSQLSEIGDLSGWRLAAAFAAVVATLVGIALAIYYATRVMTPRAVSLNRLVGEEGCSEIGKQIREDPSLLLGHGNSLVEFADRRKEALAAEDDAWEKYENAAGDEKKSLRGAVERAEAERQRIDEAMAWLFSYARFVEASRSFRTTLRAMFAAAAVAAVGIAGFAWAAHPEDEQGQPGSVVAKAPIAVEVDLGADGRATLADDLGDDCDVRALPAVAIGGTAEELEVVTIPSETCTLDRFVLTPELGTYHPVETVAEGEEPIRRKGNPAPPAAGG